jgi:hypothetical protein
MAKRVIMRIELEPKSKKGLDEYCDRTGVTKVAAVSRLIDWFCTQPDGIQSVIQGLFPSHIEADVAEIVLKRLVKAKNVRKSLVRSNGQQT